MLAALAIAAAALSAEVVCEMPRDEGPDEVSGISHVARDTYFCVNDKGGWLHEVTITVRGGEASPALQRASGQEGQAQRQQRRRAGARQAAPGTKRRQQRRGPGQQQQAAPARGGGGDAQAQPQDQPQVGRDRADGVARGDARRAPGRGHQRHRHLRQRGGRADQRRAYQEPGQPQRFGDPHRGVHEQVAALHGQDQSQREHRQDPGKGHGAASSRQGRFCFTLCAARPGHVPCVREKITHSLGGKDGEMSKLQNLGFDEFLFCLLPKGRPATAFGASGERGLAARGRRIRQSTQRWRE